MCSKIEKNNAISNGTRYSISKTKINVFGKKFSHSACPFGIAPYKKNSKNVDFSLEVNSANCPLKLNFFFLRILEYLYSHLLSSHSPEIRGFC